MREDRKTALPMTWGEGVKWQKEDLEDKIEVAANTATIMALAGIYAHERQQTENERKNANRDRGLGDVQRKAVMAGAIVIADQYGKRDFPVTQYAMARAIADKAADFGIELDPHSTSVQNVAAALLDAALRLNKRDCE